MSSDYIVCETKILLTNENYPLWLLLIEAKLHKLKYLNVVPRILAYVSSSLPEANKFNGNKLWTLLKSKYAGDDLTAKTTPLKQSLVEMKPTDVSYLHIYKQL
ncbi:hypothetical protein PTTG_03508 [Puccinia triticina 1-1 BBBD Race 1]|uniref:Uncharacterized protein n=1 Tax=Puccinia triticina (isolate 1-1 / race 1 (BBBD)) TaxID=630390 RepID=A0A180GRW4_PUCT1|nr:hypothetical protein PTTG_03508 [Puccinia triticina 1-1 BBBD Race 1]